jgi:N-acyl-D-amino-acid deacylase
VIRDMERKGREGSKASDPTGLLVVAFVALIVSAQAAPGAQGARATTIVGADLADGTGRAIRRANVRIVGDRVAAVGTARDVRPQDGDTVIDASGLVVAPGFIDIHNHSSGELASDPAAASQIAQGITTVVLGPDGGSPWPIGAYLEERRLKPAALNIATFVGHATVRREVMGDDYKRADGGARRSGDARGRGRSVERARV